MYACCGGSGIKLLEREVIKINQVNKMETVALKLLEREDININYVNQVNCIGYIALDYAIENNMESVIKRIKELQKKKFL